MSLLPAALAARVQALSEGEREAIEPLAEDIATWLDGKPVDALRALLDELRDEGLYPLSLRLLATAWSEHLSDAMAGEIAEDWIGTLLHGLGDREAAVDIARHITPDALKRGAAFAGDLGDLLLEWQLFEVATPLVELAATRNPGDAAAQFNLGVVRKWAGRFEESAAAFRVVLASRDDKAAQWNLGIAATAQRDFRAAREAWTRLGLRIPESDGDFAAPGERIPVRLPAAPDAPVVYEIVWADRMCPARARLTGIPRYDGPCTLHDVVLIDGVSVGQVQTDKAGAPLEILPYLAVFSRAGGRLFRLRPVEGASLTAEALSPLVAALRARGYAAIDWTGIGPSAAAIGIILPDETDAAKLHAVVEAERGALPLYCPELDEAAGAPQRLPERPLSRW